MGCFDSEEDIKKKESANIHFTICKVVIQKTLIK